MAGLPDVGGIPRGPGVGTGMDSAYAKELAGRRYPIQGLPGDKGGAGEYGQYPDYDPYGVSMND